jgi:hypothetical protein
MQDGEDSDGNETTLARLGQEAKRRLEVARIDIASTVPVQNPT